MKRLFLRDRLADSRDRRLRRRTERRARRWRLNRRELKQRADHWALRSLAIEEENVQFRSLNARYAEIIAEQERKLDRVRELEHQVAELEAQRDALERENAAATRRAEKLNGLLAQAAAAFESPDRLLDLAGALRSYAYSEFNRGASG